MKFSYTEVWNDAIALLRANASLIVALAGVFLFLPSLIVAYLLPAPQPSDPATFPLLLREWLQANWHWFLLDSLIGWLGSLAILFLVLGEAGQTVSGAIGRAARLLPSYVVGMVVWYLVLIVAMVPGLLAGAVLGGSVVNRGPLLLAALLMAVACIYLLGRTGFFGATMVAQTRNPATALLASFELSKRRGWAIGGLVTIIFVAGFIVNAAISAVAGTVFILIAGNAVGRLLSLLVGAVLTSALYALLTIVYAAIYRRLTAKPAASAAAGD